MVTKSTISGAVVGGLTFVLLIPTPLGWIPIAAAGLTTAAATRYIASRYIFHEQRARDEFKEKADYFKDRLHRVRTPEEFELLVENIKESELLGKGYGLREAIYNKAKKLPDTGGRISKAINLLTVFGGVGFGTDKVGKTDTVKSNKPDIEPKTRFRK